MIHHRPLSGSARVNVVTLEILIFDSLRLHWSGLNGLVSSHGFNGLRAASVSKSTAPHCKL